MTWCHFGWGVWKWCPVRKFWEKNVVAKLRPSEVVTYFLSLRSAWKWKYFWEIIKQKMLDLTAYLIHDIPPPFRSTEIRLGHISRISEFSDVSPIPNDVKNLLKKRFPPIFVRKILKFVLGKSILLGPNQCNGGTARFFVSLSLSFQLFHKSTFGR